VYKRQELYENQDFADQEHNLHMHLEEVTCTRYYGQFDLVSYNIN